MKINQGTVRSYVTGFVLSLVLTLAAYFAVVGKVFEPVVVMGVILFLGLVQAAVQLVLFLYLGKETKPRWNMFSFVCMVSVAMIVVGGSLWIMAHLNYNVMGH